LLKEEHVTKLNYAIKIKGNLYEFEIKRYILMWVTRYKQLKLKQHQNVKNCK